MKKPAPKKKEIPLKVKNEAWTREQEDAAFWNLELFKQHPLVIYHGCTPGKVMDAYISVGKARSRLTASVVQICDPIECAIESFWALSNQTLFQRFLTVAHLMENIEALPNLNLDAIQFTKRLAGAGRRKPKGALTIGQRVDFWLLDNWLRGQQVCLLNNAQIAEKAIEANFNIEKESEQTPEAFIKKRIEELGYLKSPKKRVKATTSERDENIKKQVTRSRKAY